MKGFEKRYLFKRAFRDLLPQEIITKKKHGFGIPVATWMKSDPRMRELVARHAALRARSFERGYFRRRFIEDLFRKHETDDPTATTAIPLDLPDAWSCGIASLVDRAAEALA